MLRYLALISLLTSTCACAADPAPISPLGPQQAAAVEGSCTTIMGLRQGEFAYAMCKESLTATATAMLEGQARLAAYDTCHGRGMPPGSAALATCMLEDKNNSAPAQAIYASTPITLDALRGNGLSVGDSYYNVTHAVQWRREQYSCAQLGLVPGSSAFGHCVASLDADLVP